MTRPPDPGQPPRRPSPGAPGGGPYGPPGRIPGPTRPQPQPPPQHAGPAQGWAPEAAGEPEYRSEGKGLLATLLETNFDELITPRLIRIFYRLILTMVTIWALFSLAIGLWLFQYGWLLTVATFIFVPPSWLGVMILVRLFMEGIIVHFKGVEYLRVMKDKDGAR